MKINNPYETVYFSFKDSKAIISEIARYLIIDYPYIQQKSKLQIKPFEKANGFLNPIILYGFTDIEKDIPAFSHPIINPKDNWIALDLRPYVNVDKNNFTFEERNTSEYELTLTRFVLTALWYTDKTSDMYSLKFAHIAFATWISDNLSKRFALSLEDAIRVKIVALIYYANLFKTEFTDDDFSKLVIRLKDEIFSIDLLKEIYEETKGLYDSLDHFGEACYIATGNLKLKGLNAAILINLTLNNWIGINGKELTILALEHPPTWISIVYAALTQRSFKKNFITNIVDKLNKRGKGDDFNKALLFLVKQHLKD